MPKDICGILIGRDLNDKLMAAADSESKRTGWNISVEDVIRRALKIMSEHNVLKSEETK